MRTVLQCVFTIRMMFWKDDASGLCSSHLNLHPAELQQITSKSSLTIKSMVANNANQDKIWLTFFKHYTHTVNVRALFEPSLHFLNIQICIFPCDVSHTEHLTKDPCFIACHLTKDRCFIACHLTKDPCFIACHLTKDPCFIACHLTKDPCFIACHLTKDPCFIACHLIGEILGYNLE